MISSNRFIKKILFSVIGFLLPVVSLAQVTGAPPVVGIKNPINQTTIDGFLQTLLTGVIKIGIPIIALSIIYSGFLFVMARGAPEEINKAKQAFTFSIIGAAILLGAWALAQLISETVLNLG